jgi:hypothetical protein
VALKVEASCEEREKKGGEWWRAQKRGNNVSILFGGARGTSAQNTLSDFGGDSEGGD